MPGAEPVQPAPTTRFGVFGAAGVAGLPDTQILREPLPLRSRKGRVHTVHTFQGMFPANELSTGKAPPVHRLWTEGGRSAAELLN